MIPNQSDRLKTIFITQVLSFKIVIKKNWRMLKLLVLICFS